MTRRAVDEGWTGLRLLTDVTELVADADGRRQWMRAEHRLDRYTRGHPITVLCGYDADDLPEEVIADAAILHPLTRGTPSPFVLRVTDPDGSLALWGEVDAASADDLHRAITSIGPELPARVLVDVSELRFIDHTGLAACDAAAREVGVIMTLAGTSPLVRWIVGTLGLANVRTGSWA
jgi:anti-anti-sigma regulatory factor